MRYMLDTCTLIYMIFNPERLSPAALKIVEGNHALYASIASVWEIMIKEQIGKLDIDETSAMELEKICYLSIQGFQISYIGSTMVT